MSELTKEQEYEIVSSTLSSLTSLRRFCNSKSYDWLEEVNEKLMGLIDERREDEEKRKAELEEIESRRLKVIAFAEELGLSPDQLTVSVFELEQQPGKKVKSTKNNKPKYRFTDPDTGKTETWTGQGRKKKGLQKLLDAGHSIEEFLIETDNSNKDS